LCGGYQQLQAAGRCLVVCIVWSVNIFYDDQILWFYDGRPYCKALCITVASVRLFFKKVNSKISLPAC
jgi:hypothetical protein